MNTEGLMEWITEGMWQLPGVVGVERDAFRPVINVVFDDRTEADITVKFIEPDVVVDIDKTMRSQEGIAADVASGSRSSKVEVGVDPEVRAAREAIDEAIPPNRWSWMPDGRNPSEFVIAPSGKHYRVPLGVASVLVAEINKELFADA
jgi:hypothetical protein